jgi:predicted PurR-regulated permease PerM
MLGKHVELQPFTVVFALTVGGHLGGMAGVYLSVPAVAVLRIVWRESFSTRNSSTALADKPLIQVKA